MTVLKQRKSFDQYEAQHLGSFSYQPSKTGKKLMIATKQHIVNYWEFLSQFFKNCLQLLVEKLFLRCLGQLKMFLKMSLTIDRLVWEILLE